MDSDDEGPESEENDQEVTLYPLEGKYVDEADKRKRVFPCFALCFSYIVYT
jgi:hypothetical protein